MKKTLLFLFILTGLSAWSQEKPKLVVGIVVDQMRQDYIYRYWDTFGEDGFKRLIESGFIAHNAHYNYAPTATGPGHASVYTGTTPQVHGIIGNSWYDKKREQNINCVSDFTGTQTVGRKEEKTGRSPNHLLAGTLTDALRVTNQMRSRVISVSFKDRGAILPGGHTANLALWYDWDNDCFISSTHYVEELPKWVNKFNKNKGPKQYAKLTWEPALPLDQYKASGPDDTPYENSLRGDDKPVFPYNMAELTTESYGAIISTPFGNDLLTDLAIEALEGEELGQKGETDFLAISYSTTDYIGHSYGPNAVETQDTYIRLDKNIAALLKKLDNTLGEGNYTLFLTADHGVADVPQQNIDRKIAAGYLQMDVKSLSNTFIQENFGLENAVKAFSSFQVIFDEDVVPVKDRISIRATLAEYLTSLDGIYVAYTRDQLINTPYNDRGIKSILARGHHPERSGDLYVMLDIAWLGGSSKRGTSHGTAFAYDTHIPMLFFGYGVEPGETYSYRRIIDIAPTLSGILKIQLPNASTGEPVEEAIK